MKIDWYKVEEWVECIAVLILGLFIIFGFAVLVTSVEKEEKETRIFSQKCHEAQGIVIEEAGNNRLVCVPAVQIKIGKNNDKQ